MIIGNGMIARSLKYIDSDEVCFFASGVSSSNTKNSKVFDREKNLLLEVLDRYAKTKIIVYFSSCGIKFEATPYFDHKLNMENIIASRAENFYIFRLPQVVGNGGNKNTLFNHLISKVKNNESIEVWKNVRRNLIDIDDVVDIINIFLSNKINLNSIVNIASPYNCTILELIKNIEIVLSMKVNYTLVNKGKTIYTSVAEISDIVDINRVFKSKNQYLQHLIKKYHKEVI
jgi:nucleoside-diphosphate-sugar epimerase